MTHITTTDTLFMLVYRTGVYSEMPATWADLNKVGINAALFISEAEAEAARTDAVTMLEAAGNGETELARNLRNARVITLSRFILDSHTVKQSRNAAIDRQGELSHAIETYLKDGIEGTTDPEGFMRETEALAEAIGFEFTEEREFTMKVTFTAKVKRSQTYFDSSDFSVEVESETDDIDGIEDIDWQVTGN
jgi:hypothetical protein